MAPLCGRNSHNPGDRLPEKHLQAAPRPGEVHGHFGDADHNYYGQRFAVANTISQSPFPNIGFDSEDATARDLHSCVQTAHLSASGGNGLFHDTGNYMAVTNPGPQSPGQRNGVSRDHLIHRRSFSIEEPTLASMTSVGLSESRHSSAPPHMPGQHYGPFLGRFRTSEEAKGYRRDRMRFGRRPWRDPESDPTIAETENSRDYHVERIYNAMISGEFARDNAKSTALKRWVHEPHYQADLVEAYAHKVFDCLLEQVKHGFRGWHQNDYVNDERKGEDDDKDIDCAGRLGTCLLYSNFRSTRTNSIHCVDNIVAALQQEKSICENVMSSAWQIRMFVNAPKAYAKRKDQNRVGNSKRPNAKSTDVADDSSRALKRARNTVATRPRQVRDRSSIAQLPPSRGPALQQQYQQAQSPYFTPSVMHSTTMSPSQRFLPLQAPLSHFSPPSHGPSPSHETSLVPQSATPLTRRPPPTPGRQETQRMTSMPPMPPDNVFASPLAKEAKPVPPPSTFKDWQTATHAYLAPSASQQLDTLDVAATANEQQQQQQDMHTPFSGCHETPAYASMFEPPHSEMGVSLADMEFVSLQPPMDDDFRDQAFHGYWH